MCSSSPGSVVAGLEAALDALAAEDVTFLGAAATLERTRRLVAAQNRIAAELARTVRHAGTTQASELDGLVSTASWLRGHCRMSPAASARVATAGRVLEHLPAVAASFAAGEVTAEQVAVVAPVATPARLADAEAAGVDLAGVDAALAEVARTRPHQDLVTVVHHYLERLDPDGAEPDPTEARSLTIAKHADGSISGRFELDALGGEKVQTALESLVQADRPAGDTRTRAQRQGDALVQLADILLATGGVPVLRTVRPHLVVTIDLDDLVDPTPGRATAEAGFGALLSAARTRWGACDPDITRITLGPDGLPLDVGRTERLVPAHVRKAVERRDRHCVFAGCGAPTWWCEVHHLLEWALGGATSLENSALLCERHHTKVHHGFRVGRRPDGRWRTWRPDGTEILLAECPLAA